MACVPAPACKAALAEATRLFPTRSTASDGICASAQHHQQNPTSDHETGEAFDVTHDPANGCDVDALFARVVARRDARVKYLIRNRRILRAYDKPGIPAWTWAPYTGPDPHVHHGHCSIVHAARNNTAPWFATTAQPPIPQEDEDMAHRYGDKSGADRSQVLVDGPLAVIIKHKDSAVALDDGKVTTILLDPGDYADIKAQATNRDD